MPNIHLNININTILAVSSCQQRTINLDRVTQSVNGRAGILNSSSISLSDRAYQNVPTIYRTLLRREAASAMVFILFKYLMIFLLSHTVKVHLKFLSSQNNGLCH